MAWLSYFHHPDICLPVIRRRATEELLDLLLCFGGVLATRGRSLSWKEPFASPAAYDTAVSRLKKKGLLAYRRDGEGNPILDITTAGAERAARALRPHRQWRKRWKGIWYVVVYDVPEGRRRYRDNLRHFLKRMRMGCLQRSVWVSPWDIRPDYDDLTHAAAVEDISFLFEARTVLGRDPMHVVQSAWDWDRLETIHGWYVQVISRNLDQILSGKIAAESLPNLAREELSAYVSAMEEDPLLPQELHPANYRGREVLALHRNFVKSVGRRL
ncbi:MAG: hypothetical protein JXR37_01260 [Kiritimatiellae bacterium]|nr:hypothetical protein [Kiritimatiellia bacterium]